MMQAAKGIQGSEVFRGSWNEYAHCGHPSRLKQGLPSDRMPRQNPVEYRVRMGHMGVERRVLTIWVWGILVCGAAGMLA